MNSIYQLAETVLYTPDIEQKLLTTGLASQLLASGQLDLQDNHQPPRPICDTRFPQNPQLVSPRHLPRRSQATREGAIGLLHAIAHIEFYAIHLAWDILYRFRQMPEAFQHDWLKIAQEEALHFSLIRRRLHSLDSDYGRLSAHRGLWEVAEDTDHDLLARLALVPRHMEAKGLDVTPGMIGRFTQVGDEESAAILRRILDDEVGHVATGSRWFHYLCQARGLAPETTWFMLLERHLRGAIRGPFNLILRQQAGFSDSEMEQLQQLAARKKAI